MKLIIKILLISVLSLIFTTESVAKKDKKLLSLTGTWKFAIGDDMSRAEAGFDDSAWEDIYVPSSWEDEGYPGYDGYAWYRKTFDYTERMNDEDLTLVLGFIDDVDEVYLNGVLIGLNGSFPPHYITSYNFERRYHIPLELLYKDNANTIAVRVYDNRLQGGILRGSVGIYIDDENMLPDLILAGKWKYMTGDEDNYSDINFDDSKWFNLHVPLRWDYQGFDKYDGFAWYRKTFTLPENLKDEVLILLLGKIDDYDQTFINGVKIGQTGTFPIKEKSFTYSKEWQMERAYYIPPDLIKPKGKNVISVRVYDGFDNGGIFEGQIGIITQDRYKKIKLKQKNKFKNIWELLFGD